MKEKIQELERQIAALPIGYISKKTINGKTRYYHQWTENGKKHSQYLRDGELEPLQEQIEQRKVLQAQLKELQAKMPKVRQPKLDFETSVIVGKGLAAMSQGVKGWGLRDCFRAIGGLSLQQEATGSAGFWPTQDRKELPCSGRPSPE